MNKIKELANPKRISNYVINFLLIAVEKPTVRVNKEASKRVVKHGVGKKS